MSFSINDLFIVKNYRVVLSVL